MAPITVRAGTLLCRFGAKPPTTAIHYAPPAIGCALANWLGNNGQDVIAVVVLAAVVAYTLYVLKPFSQAP